MKKAGKEKTLCAVIWDVDEEDGSRSCLEIFELEDNKRGRRMMRKLLASRDDFYASISLYRGDRLVYSL